MCYHFVWLCVRACAHSMSLTSPHEELPWKRFFEECIVPAFSELIASGIRAYPDATNGEIFECCNTCSHALLRDITDGPYLFFHSQSVSQVAMEDLLISRTVYRDVEDEDMEDEDMEDDESLEPLEEGKFTGSVSDYAELDYMNEENILYLGHWLNIQDEEEAGIGEDASRAVSILSKYMKVSWNEDLERTFAGCAIMVKPFTEGHWSRMKQDRIVLPRLYVLMCLKATESSDGGGKNLAKASPEKLLFNIWMNGPRDIFSVILPFV